MERNILLYGLQRSGTNFLQKLIEANFIVNFKNSDADRSHPRQKHFRLYDNKDLIPESGYENGALFSNFLQYETALGLKDNIDGLIILSKDPYSWLVSYNKWAVICNWPIVKHHYIEEYNAFYGSWMSFAEQDSRITFVRYRDLLERPKAVLLSLASSIGMRKRFPRSILGLRTTLTRVPQSKVFLQINKQMFLKEDFLADLTEPDLLAIESKADRILLTELGYQLLG